MRAPARIALLGAALALAFAATDGVAQQEPTPTAHYTVRADARLSRFDVEVCFDGAPPPDLGPGVAAAGSALRGAWHGERELPVTRDRVQLRGIGPDACVRYRVDLEAARRASRFSGRYGVDFMSSAGVWLWRDRRRPPVGGATIRFELPDGLVAATPWPERGGVQHLERSAFRRPSFVAFGRFTPRIVEQDGVRAKVVRLGDGWAMDDDDTERWLREAITGLSTVQGRFPVERLLVVLVPQGGRSLGFGMVRRGGGHSVAFQVGTNASVDDITHHWVSWHELSHLQLPALPQRDAWLYEGLATYYQEVVQARVGVQSPQTAWGELTEGFGRGQRAGARRSLGETSDALFSNYAFMRVYWAGTAFALESDVALRERGSSLDAAIARAAPRWRNDLSLWSSERVCAAWDRTLDARVLRPMRDRYEGSVAFPEIAPLLRRLGVANDGRLQTGELSGVRDAIMARPTP